MQGLSIDWSVGLGDILTAILAPIGLLTVFFAALQLKHSRRAQETQLLVDLQQRFRSINQFTVFLYRLDYDGPRRWSFEPQDFPHSPEEAILDAILYEFSFVGALVGANDIRAKDLIWLKTWIGIVLQSSEVQGYLSWLRSENQLPNHDAFLGALTLYKAVYGRDEHYKRLVQCYPIK